jgi:hypothetical protein
MPGVDELFGGPGGPGGAPPEAPSDRLRSARRWMTAGLIGTVAGPCCFTGVPGAAALLWAFFLADEEVARRALLSDAAGQEAATVTRGRAAWCMGIAMVLLLVQIVMFSVGLYELLFEAALQLVALLRGADVGV